jgi:uracil-DNA glycosylase
VSIDRGLVIRYLHQLVDLGIDELVLDDMTAHEAAEILAGRLVPARQDAPAPPRASARASASPRPLAAGSGDEAAVNPRARASASASPRPPAAGSGDNPAVAGLSVLQAAAGVCTRCSLHSTRTTVVFGEGNPAADIVVVGEAPGQEEDLSGRPFVGRAGRLLDLLLMTAGFPRESVYICNVLKCRPPNNRNPLADEVSACTKSFLFGQLDAIQPKVLLAVGKFAAQALLESEESISRLRGATHSYRGTPLIVTYHPAYLLRSPQMTRVAWQDFQLLRKVLHEQARG